MQPLLRHLPTAVTLAAIVALLVHGPIAQPPHYHAFADARAGFGLPNANDVLSNIGFALVGLWGLLRLYPARRHAALAAGWPGYALFLVALVLTACGSAYYHWTPDDDRLVWDRLPIALACAGLLAGVRGELPPAVDTRRWALLLGAAAVISVAWWPLTQKFGIGDLRPYLLLQGLAVLLVPLWQAIHRAPRTDRLSFGIAIGLYVLAKLVELNDQAIYDLLGFVSGHTLKHLLATAAAAVLTARLVRRVAQTPALSHRAAVL